MSETKTKDDESCEADLISWLTRVESTIRDDPIDKINFSNSLSFAQLENIVDSSSGDTDVIRMNCPSNVINRQKKLFIST